MTDRPFLSTKEWIWLLVVVASMSAANMGALYQMSSALHRDMLDLDLNWQQRVAELAAEVKRDMKDVRESIPPDWFRSMVEENRKDIREMQRMLHERNGAVQ